MDKPAVERRTKIICTLGPASNTPEVIRGLLGSGMDIARLNLAHSTLDEHGRIVSLFRAVAGEIKPAAGILLDLPGSKRHSGDLRSAFGPHIEFALSQEADYIALSYITSAGEVEAVKRLLEEMGADTPVIAKIERAGALEASGEILDACDGIMVARGDLALEISFEKVPLASKRLVREANWRGKPVITATEMLLSMVRSATPSRAEAADVANAVLDGTAALMLSEETSIGSYPVEAVQTMNRIAREAELSLPLEQVFYERRQSLLPEVDDATARAACQVAYQVGARAIVAFTAGGTTAFRVSKYRPGQPILAVTPSEKIMRRLSLYWGVVPVRKSEPRTLEEVFTIAGGVAMEAGVACRGELIVITAGLPLTVPGSTNLLKVHIV